MRRIRSIRIRIIIRIRRRRRRVRRRRRSGRVQVRDEQKIKGHSIFWQQESVGSAALVKEYVISVN